MSKMREGQLEESSEPVSQRNEQPSVEEIAPVAAEVSPREALGRGRTFVAIYAALLFVGVVLFLTLAVLARTAGILRFDVIVSEAVQSIHQPLASWVLTQASDFGWYPGNVIAYSAVFLILFALKLRLEAILAVASSLLAGLAGGLIKIIVGRARPSAQFVHVVAALGGFSFPSGHVIQYTTLFGFTFYVVLVIWRKGIPRNIALFILAALVLLVGPSRVYLGEHWPSDVLWAYLFAGLWLTGTIELHLRLVRRFSRHEPPQETQETQERSHRNVYPIRL